MAASSETKATLPQLLQTLPQELFDKIYDFTFTAVPGERIVGRPPTYYETRRTPCRLTGKEFHQAFIGSYRSFLLGFGDAPLDRGSLFAQPDTVALLHVDRASGQKFAESFFGGEGVSFGYMIFQTMYLFLDALEPGHAAMIRCIEIVDVAMPVFEAVEAEILDGESAGRAQG